MRSIVRTHIHCTVSFAPAAAEAAGVSTGVSISIRAENGFNVIFDPINYTSYLCIGNKSKTHSLYPIVINMRSGLLLGQ